MSDRKLLSRICEASRGRNGRNSEAPAMLNMLPKLALMVVRMYLSVLANVMRPSSMPWRKMAKSCLKQHEIGGVFGHIHCRIHRDAHVGGVQGGASLMPSPI